MNKKREPVIILSREKYEILESEARIFLDKGLLGRFQRLEYLSSQDLEDLEDFRNYMFGFFSENRRRLKRMLLNFLTNRGYYEEYYEYDQT